MNKLLQIQDLTKVYPAFTLSEVSFSLHRGEIMGLIGRNGAGKTTILKSLLRLIRPTSGEIRFFGLPLAESEGEIKQRIGYIIGGVHYYPRKTVKEILSVASNFYPNWDANICKDLLIRFAIDPQKKLMTLSEGMKVKFHLVLALSHHAELLILDEPTSGLDPVSRLELLDLFRQLQKEGVSILFSTHVISDLTRCADSITYLRKGKVVDSMPMTDFFEKYRTEAEVYSQQHSKIPRNIDLEDIMMYLEQEGTK